MQGCVLKAIGATSNMSNMPLDLNTNEDQNHVNSNIFDKTDETVLH